MHPEEQPYQEAGTSQPYGMYTGAEQPAASASFHDNNSNNGNGQGYTQGNEGWNRGGEGMGGMQQGQQQMYSYTMPFPTAMRVLPEGRTFAILSYALGWFSGLVILFFNWENRFVRFHALQATLFFGFINVFDVMLVRMMSFGFGWHHRPTQILLVLGVFLLVNTIAVIAWVVGMVQAGLGNYYTFPVVGWMIRRKLMPQTPPVK